MAKLKKAATVPTPRHSFATHLLEANTEVRVIQVPLGHAKLTNHCAFYHVATKTIRSTVSPYEQIKLLLDEPPATRDAIATVTSGQAKAGHVSLPNRGARPARGGMHQVRPSSHRL